MTVITAGKSKSKVSPKAKTPKAGKVTSSKDEVNDSIASAFESVVGKSLPAEMKAYLRLEGLMVSGALSSRGAEATVKRAEEIGSLPSFRSSWCRDIPLVAQLRKKEGNEDLTLKALFAIANDGRKAFPTTKKGAVSFLSVIEGGKDITEIAVEVEAEKSKQAKAKKARGAGKQTADEKKAGKGKVNEQMSALIKALNEPKVGKLNLILVDELLELCTAILIEAEQAAA
jgi:hypothetical protein